MRWALVVIAFCACKSEPHAKPETNSTMRPSEPNGARRYPEVDAAIDAMRPALLLAEPTETISACAGPLEVFAIDHEAALQIAAGRAARPGALFTTPAQIDAVVRYASKSQLAPGDESAIRSWASARPRDAVWGFLETTPDADPAQPGDSPFVEHGYEGVLHVIDPKTRTVLCHTPITARSRETVAEAVRDKLATLRAGTDVVTLPDPATDNRGPRLAAGRIPDGPKWYCIESTSDRNVTMCERDRNACVAYYKDNEALGYTECSERGTAVCVTFRDIAKEKDRYWCHKTMASCMNHRRVLKTFTEQPMSGVSACVELGSTPAK